MIVFISGKITGDANYRDKFQNAQRFLEKQGYMVLSPAVLPWIPWEACMRITLAMMKEADIIAFLPDWRDSPGARIEYYYSQLLNKPRIMLGKGTNE